MILADNELVLWGKIQTFLDAIHKKLIQYGNNMKNATFL